MKPRKRTLKNGDTVWDARWYGPDGREKAKTFTPQLTCVDPGKLAGRIASFRLSSGFSDTTRLPGH